MAMEQALAGEFTAMMQILISGRFITNRDGGVYDQLPWQWSPSTQAKRDAFSRFTGRGYPREGYPSPYHMLLDMMRRDACAEVGGVLIENTALLGSLVLGGALVLERRLPMSDDSGMYAAGAGVTTERVGAGGHELPEAEVEVKVDGADAANAPPAEKRSLDSPPLGTL